MKLTPLLHFALISTHNVMTKNVIRLTCGFNIAAQFVIIMIIDKKYRQFGIYIVYSYFI